MEKIVKDVFKNPELQNAKILNSSLREVKFSKKLNLAIIDVESVENISLFEIEKFEEQAKEIYKLSDFKINYKYIGDKLEVDEKKVREILVEISSNYLYALEAFRNAEIKLENRNIYIKFFIQMADLLRQKGLDMYIKKCIEIKYGTKYEVFLSDDESAKNEDSGNNLNIVYIQDVVNRHVNQNEKKEEIKVQENKQNEAKKQFVPRALTEEEKRIRDLKEPQPEYVIIGRDITEDRVRFDNNRWKNI